MISIKIRKSSFLIILSILSFIPNISSLYAQEDVPDKKEIIDLTNDADGYFIYDENYTKAAEIYERLLQIDPDNYNLNYKLGVCYLNINGKKAKALDLLSYAAQNFADDFKYSTIGTEAPFDVLFYLAYAYQINMKLEDAIRYYKDYQSQLTVDEASEITFIDLQIKACRNAQQIDTGHFLLDKQLFAPWLIKFRNAAYPVVSENDSVFIFTIRETDGNRIYSSFKSDSSWEEPVEITDQLGRYGDMYSNSIAGDGKTLILVRNNGIHGDIYISHYSDGKWSRIKKLGKNINSRYWEAAASISADGKLLYFSSNRPGGLGSLDIYVSEKSDDWSFGPAKNIGRPVNSTLEENNPCFDSRSGILYFSSTGHEGIGGFDIFYSEYDKNWSQPVHLPYPVNTTGDDLSFVPYFDSNRGIMSITRTDTSSSTNLYLISLKENEAIMTITAKGKVTLEDGMPVEREKLSIELSDADNDTVMTALKADSAGLFTTELAKGSYTVIISYPGYTSDTLNLKVSSVTKGQEITANSLLYPMSVDQGHYLTIRTILFEFDSYKLSREAMVELEKIIPALLEREGLRLEIKGYADPVGTKQYNLELSEKRAETVCNYLVDKGINRSRITVKGLGESDFITDNRNPDGSDNAEGRRYNRRVSIGIVNDGYSIPVETFRYIPHNLMKYSGEAFWVLVKESENAVPAGYFTQFNRSELAFIREFRSDDKYLYAMGRFNSRTDALDYLLTVRDAGFADARIIPEYELPGYEEVKQEGQNVKLYTIQIHALTAPATDPFPGLSNVREIRGSDGFYRYVVGEYRGYSKAKAALALIQSLGYPQAFIKEVDLLEVQTLKKESDAK